jgi:hypothetical protein
MGEKKTYSFVKTHLNALGGRICDKKRRFYNDHANQLLFVTG